MLHGYNPPSRFLPYLSWTEIAALTSDGSGRLLWRDTDVRSGQRHRYRLRYRDGAAERITEEVWIDVPGIPLALRLAIAGRQPVTGPLTFDLAAPEAWQSPAAVRLP